MNAVIGGVILYVAIQLAVGAWVARRISSETDYILAGRQLGVGLAAASVFATWFGAEVVMGAAGRVYSQGLSGAQAEPFAYAVGVLLMAAAFAAPLWRRGISTFADFFRDRYAPSVERLAAILLIPGAVLWAAAQIRGFGQIVSSASGMPVVWAITLAAAVVIVYTMMGGLLADVYTDLVQGVAIVAGLAAIVAIVAADQGGPATALASVPPAKWNFLGEGQSLLKLAEKWAIPICGSVVAIELISRMLACRSPQVARRAAGIGGTVYLLVALVPVFLGLTAGHLVPGLGDPEQFVPDLARAKLPTFFYVLFIGALISAILSTVDSALLAAGSIASHNLLLRWRPETSPRGRLLFSRLSVVSLGLVAFVLAISARGISDLVETASAFASAGIFVVLVMGLFTRIGGPASAIAAILAGAGVWLAGHGVLGLEAPYIAGIGAAFVAYLGVAALERHGGVVAAK